MDWLFWRRKSDSFKEEESMINSEISRSKRFGFRFGVLTVEVSHTVPRGLSNILPGRTISFHILKKNLRSYDQVIGFDLWRRYYVILPQTDKNGIEIVKARIYQIAEKEKWGDISVNSVAYPDDGNDPKGLLDRLTGNVSQK
ncbi:MAG: hypothetical protein A2Z39_04455 [Deltaproteobacteria bacterium RBG_19FT_COMBO_46_9]|nr:MAG: hypothetical protein A2Z39_04455 [Deltaproteobacteria bacterium RBG_19FT_COMBO_46_9]